MFLIAFCCRYRPTEVPATTVLSAGSSSTECTECGATTRSGKRSCCARGGAWFKNCGDTDDTKFDHTWAEGIRACKGFVPSIVVKAPLQAILRHVHAGVMLYPLNTTQRLNAARHQTDIHHRGGVPSDDGVGVTKAVLCFYAFVIISNLST